ncbi:hypothetical protein ACMV_P1_00840 (plasmid) [Acidiphilium multivorum AIU301]|uniref:Uncharacterized protein n=1 Tax=Acidiphilium multivorum (strain DSM 11245 / JCM 8867 / NBRC 100883 / AIU 301) TaxID=926570 RepID=F0J713_ACIMA|nr:hypothetical protein [Acidiphilium multivorum]BAJ82880.1 hypothetical protein ACMV_P1_00840 [Acidiphilium multivorum AIU301]GAN73866.1 hypothetical protein Apmu_0120_08 [Acidiphilium multivorum AIU301]
MTNGDAVVLSRYPQLRFIASQLTETTILTEAEALALYERNWRFLDLETMDDEERRFLDSLVRGVGKGVLNI